MKKAKLFNVNDCDIIIAENKKEAIDWYCNEWGGDIDEAVEVKSYSKKHWHILRDMKELKRIVAICGPSKIGFFSGELAVFIFYRVSMDFYDGEIPYLFSSSEW